MIEQMVAAAVDDAGFQDGVVETGAAHATYEAAENGGWCALRARALWSPPPSRFTTEVHRLPHGGGRKVLLARRRLGRNV